MEEAWELAVVSELEVVKPSNKWRYSGAHSRLRFQLVTISIIFFLVRIYGVTDVDLPFNFVKLGFENGETPKSYISLFCLGLFIFWFLTLINFMILSVNEKGFERYNEKGLEAKVKELSIEIERLKNSLASFSNLRVSQELHDLINTLRNTITPPRGISQNHLNLGESQVEVVSFMDESISKIDGILNQRINEINNADAKVNTTFSNLKKFEDESLADLDASVQKLITKYKSKNWTYTLDRGLNLYVPAGASVLLIFLGFIRCNLFEYIT